MPYEIIFDELVYCEDLRRINKRDQDRILRIIAQKLGTSPFAYGEPLRKELFGYWKCVWASTGSFIARRISASWFS